MKLDEALKRIVIGNLPTTVESIYQNVLNYLLEYYLQKKGCELEDLDAELDFFDESHQYEKTIKDCVRVFTDGLESLGLSPVTTSKHFYIHFKEIVQDPDLKTLNAWIQNRFAPFILEIYLEELFKFLAGSFLDSVIPKIIELDLIPDQALDELMEFKDNYPKIERIYKRFMVSTDLLDQLPKMEPLLEFQNVEQDLQALYFTYRIYAYFNWESRMDLPRIKQFLSENQPEWSEFGRMITLSRPSLLYCGLFLAFQLDAQIDTAIPLKVQKKALVSLINSQEEPLREDPFLVDTVLKLLQLLKLNLSTKFKNGLKKNAGYDLDEFEDEDLATVFKFVHLLDHFDLFDDFSPEKKLQLLEILKRYETAEGAYKLFPDDEVASPDACYAAFSLAKLLGALGQIDLDHLLDFFLVSYEEGIKDVDFQIPETLADIWYSLQFFDALEELPDEVFLDFIAKYLGVNPVSVQEEPQVELPEKPQAKDQGDLVATITSALQNIETVPEPTPEAGPTVQAPAVQKVSSLASGDTSQDTTPLKIPKIAPVKTPTGPSGGTGTGATATGDEEGEFDDFVTAPEEESQPGATPPAPVGDTATTPVTVEPDCYLQQFREVTPVANSIRTKLQIDLEFLQNPKESIWAHPQWLMYYLLTLELLDLPRPSVDYGQIVSQYRKGVAFGELDATHPDPKTTAYLVVIANLTGALGGINRTEVKKYLLGELQVCHPLNFTRAMEIAIALYVLTPPGVPPVANPDIISKFLQLGYEHVDPGAPLEDAFALVTFLRAVGAERSLTLFQKPVKREASTHIDFSGSIDRLVSVSAKTLLLFVELDMLADPGAQVIVREICKYFEKHVAFFTPDMWKDAVGSGFSNLEFQYFIEYALAFWALVALAILHPEDEAPEVPACPNCGAQFEFQPKFCNKCGHKFA